MAPGMRQPEAAGPRSLEGGPRLMAAWSCRASEPGGMALGVPQPVVIRPWSLGRWPQACHSLELRGLGAGGGWPSKIIIGDLQLERGGA
jgi:hypothetical protein